MNEIEQLERFHERRLERATSPQGPLALTNTQWVDSEQPIWGVPGVWAPAPEGLGGLALTAVAADAIEVDGSLVDGTVYIAGDDAMAPSTIRFGEGVTGTVIANEEHTSYGLRVWDAASEANQGFGTIDAFPYDPSWVITAEFAPTESGTEVAILHQKDAEARSKPCPVSSGSRATASTTSWRPSRQARATVSSSSSATPRTARPPTRSGASCSPRRAPTGPSRSTSTARSCLPARSRTTSTARSRRSRTASASPSRRGSATCSRKTARCSTSDLAARLNSNACSPCSSAAQTSRSS